MGCFTAPPCQTSDKTLSSKACSDRCARGIMGTMNFLRWNGGCGCVAHLFVTPVLNIFLDEFFDSLDVK